MLPQASKGQMKKMVLAGNIPSVNLTGNSTNRPIVKSALGKLAPRTRPSANSAPTYTPRKNKMQCNKSIFTALNLYSMTELTFVYVQYIMY